MIGLVYSFRYKYEYTYYDMLFYYGSYIVVGAKVHKSSSKKNSNYYKLLMLYSI